MSEERALIFVTKIKEDSEFFAIRNLDEAKFYFTRLPPKHHFGLVHKFASLAAESKEPDAQIVAEFFSRAARKGLCTAVVFEKGLSPIAEIIDDIAVDAPGAFELFATIVRGTRLDEAGRRRLASKAMYSDELLALQ